MALSSSASSWLAWMLSYILLGSSMLASAQTASDYYVHHLPGQPEGPLLKMHAGHVEVSPETNGNLFFWHFENRHIANRHRTVIWFNGGPGCSSMDGALMEVGPYRVKNDHTLEYNNGSWDEFANLLFVDQPVGTGFSYVNTDSYLHELQQAADQMIIFLEKWFKLFPEYENDDIYLAGESYAGQYIPYIAQTILNRNSKVFEANQAKWALKGLLIGNGWVSPREQYEAYLKFAYKEGLVKEGSGIAQTLESKQATCLASLDAPGGSDKVDLPECEDILQEMLAITKSGDQCYNMYDVRLKDDYPKCGMNWPPDLESMTPYLLRPDVVHALNVKSDKQTGWMECSGAVGGNMNVHRSKPSVTLLPGLLEAGVPILLFSGDKDLICNHLGTEAFINNMKWSNGVGFELSPGVWAPRHDWVFEGKAAGFWQEARNLTYVLFREASHMVPFDWPRRSRDMLDRFMRVDIASIGGDPADSRIDGEKGIQTSVGAHPNSTAVEEEEKHKLEDAEWNAYYKSGEAALVVVLLIASVWGGFVWYDRRRRRRQGYRGVQGESDRSETALDRFRNKRSQNADIEAGDFDEAELDNLHSDTPRATRDMERDHYAVGEESDDEGVNEKPYTDDRLSGRHGQS